MSRTRRDIENAKTKQYRREGYDLRTRFPQRRNDGKGAGFVGCSCWLCQWGIHHGYKSIVTGKVRANRRNVKRSLRSGNFDVPEKFSVGYTD